MYFWNELKREILVQTFYNIYAGKVFMMSFLVSTHILARENLEICPDFDELNGKIRYNVRLEEYIREKVRYVAQE